MRTTLRSRWVLGYRDGDHALLRDAEVVYEDDAILFVGHRFPGTSDAVVDCGEALLSPGFVDLDALGDIAYGLLDWETPPERAASLLWSDSYYPRRRDLFPPAEDAFKSLYAYVQLIKHGVTTAMPITSVYYKADGETYEELAAAAEHAGRLGLRVYLGPGYGCGLHVVAADGSVSVRCDEEVGRAGLERALRFYADFDGAHGGLVRGALVPERIETQTRRCLLATRDATRELGCPVRLHAAQGAFEYAWIRARHGRTPFQYLDDLDFLDDRVAIPHALFTQGYSRLPDRPEGDDLAILRDNGVTVVHCPLVYSRYGESLESFGRYRARGLNMAMGTDTHPPDLFLNMRLGAAFARHADGGKLDGNTCADLYRAATLGGARALGRDDLGRLAPGAKADIIAVDLSGFHIGPGDDPIRTVVNAATGRDVVLSIIDGRTVMRNRVIPGIDEDALRLRAQAFFDALKRGYRERDYRGLDPDVMFPPSFPIIHEDAP